MNWGRQVLHVLRKDTRESAWLLLTYVAFTTAITINVVRPAWRPGPWIYAAAPYALVVFGAAVIASIVQADSPFKPDAFWRSKPFHPSAVFAAKLVLVVVVFIGVPTVGQLLALVRCGVPVAQLYPIVSRALLFTGSSYAVGLVVGAFTGDLTAFATAGILSYLLRIALLNDVAQRVATNLGFLDGWRVPVLIAWHGVLLAVVMWAYQSRDVRRWPWLVLLTVLYLPLQPIVMSVGVQAPFVRAGHARAPGDLATVRIDSVQRMTSRGVSVGALNGVPSAAPVDTTSVDTTSVDTTTVAFTVLPDGGAASERLVLSEPSVTLERADGRQQVTRHPRNVLLRSGSRTALLRVRWLDPMGATASDVSALRASQLGVREPSNVSSLRLGTIDSISDRSASNARASLLSVDAHLVAFEPHIAASLSLDSGATAQRGGERWTVTLSPRAAGLQIYLRTNRIVALSPLSLVEPAFEQPMDYVLVNESRGEAIRMTDNGGFGCIDECEWMDVPLVLPGNIYHTTDIGMWPPRQGLSTSVVLVDSAWLAKAHLVVITWTPVYARRVHASLPLHQP